MGRQLRLAQRGNVDLSFGPQDVATLHSDLPTRVVRKLRALFRAALREIRTYDAGASTERTNALDRTTTTGSVKKKSLGCQVKALLPNLDSNFGASVSLLFCYVLLLRIAVARCYEIRVIIVSRKSLNVARDDSPNH